VFHAGDDASTKANASTSAAKKNSHMAALGIAASPAALGTLTCVSGQSPMGEVIGFVAVSSILVQTWDGSIFDKLAWLVKCRHENISTSNFS
jgi:hypothetical protein